MKKYELPTLYRKTPNPDVTSRLYDALHEAGLDRTTHGMLHLEATLRKTIRYTDTEKQFILHGFPNDKTYQKWVIKDQITKAALRYIEIEKNIAQLPYGRPIQYFQKDTLFTAPNFQD